MAFWLLLLYVILVRIFRISADVNLLVLLRCNVVICCLMELEPNS